MQMAKNHLCIPSSAITSSRMSRKRRATMHINRKPGEQLRSIGHGDPATIIDRIPVKSPKPIYLSA